MKTLVSTIAFSTMLALPAAAASLSLSGGTLSTIPGGTATNEALAPLSLPNPLAGWYGAQVYLDSKARVTFTRLGSEAGYENSFIYGANTLTDAAGGNFFNPLGIDGFSVNNVLAGLLGFTLLADPSVADILVNSFNSVYVERYGKLECVPVQFRDERHLMRIIDKIVSRVGRRVDESQPWVDARLEDGSRVNVIVRPCAIDGPTLSIRKFARDPLTAEKLIETGTLTPASARFVHALVEARLNILISGGTGSGKTTMLNALSAAIDPAQRIVTIEDAAELQMQQDHVVRLETRPPSTEGSTVVTQRDLVRNALRMRPDRIIIGEVRGTEAFDMLQAMNTGHDGSMTTIHANSARDALSRLEQMVAMMGSAVPLQAVRRQIASGVQIVLQLSRLADGRRRIMSISEITGMEGDIITMQDIFVFRKRGRSETGDVLGEFLPTGIRPNCMDLLTAAGVSMTAETFGGTGVA